MAGIQLRNRGTVRDVSSEVLIGRPRQPASDERDERQRGDDQPTTEAQSLADVLPGLLARAGIVSHGWETNRNFA